MADVLVVGAGPVGLTLAGELARHGVRCRIVERMTQPLHLPRDRHYATDAGSVGGHGRRARHHRRRAMARRQPVGRRRPLSDAEDVFPELPYGQDFFVAIPLPAPDRRASPPPAPTIASSPKRAAQSWTRSRWWPIGLCLTAPDRYALVVDLPHQHAPRRALPAGARVYRRRCCPYPSANRRPGDEHRHSGRLQPRVETGAGGAGRGAGGAARFNVTYNLAEARSKLERKPYDVVVTDLVMDGKRDGLELLRLTKQRDPAPPVILVTAHGDVPTAVVR